MYSFNKGNNKDQGSIYITQFKTDSAFFILNFISGMPDFNMVSSKGFLSIQEKEGRYQLGDSIRIRFSLQGSNLILSSDTLLKGEKGILTRYKKSAGVTKKNSTFYLDYVEKMANVKSDSAMLFEVPHGEGKLCGNLHSKQEVKIIDSFGSFYLIELPDRLKEFLWVPKRYLSVIKK